MDDLSSRTIQRAAALLEKARVEQTGHEHREAARLARMMHDQDGKTFTLQMVDRVFRSNSRPEQARRFRELLEKFGVPEYLAPLERAMMQLGALASAFLPDLVMAAVNEKLRHDSSNVILAGEPGPLAKYLDRRRKSGTRVNLNQLGEAILGEQEAAHRMETILEHLANPAINYVSIKISAIFSQINLLDWDGTVAEICDRLRRLYRAALPEGKFVNLDMEEYRDLALTLTAFQRTLDEPEFQKLSAGIVLQAYLPDSWSAQQQLTAWAQQRVANGGAQIKVRLVKGANLAMESVEAELHDWNPAPYATKSETDSNFRRMLEFGCQPENARAVRLGVASHNLFDVALALELREKHGVTEFVELEMLEGMANHQARVVQREANGLLVYAPVVRKTDFNSAMAYLVRRLDENTAPENFLRDLFSLAPGSEAWERQKSFFLTAWERRHAVFSGSRRAAKRPHSDKSFRNAADTDWTQPAYRNALSNALNRYSPEQIPTPEPLDTVLSKAATAQKAWEAQGFEHRATLLRQCAHIMEDQRFDTVALMVHDGKKAAWEADAEVSEAIDFANYYADFRPQAGTTTSALGIVAITPPWNFPYAIPCSGVLAALMGGNAVILKPAPETVATAWRLAQQLWQAGIPRDLLHFCAIADGEVGKALITDPRVSAVVLTGAYETARMFQGWRPSLRLFAETSGKNALIVTAQADRDLAIKDLVKSAFGHAGQKCSAASLAILESEVYDDPAFRRQLHDAAASLPVGLSTRAASVVTPVIREPSPALKRALTTLDEGEEWLLEPKQLGDDPCQWSPGIRLGVKRGSWFQRTECFGPVLGLVRASDLDEAIEIQNDSTYGLTGGIHSLDDGEVARWRERVQVGNAYINRPITGAIVQRQPFGGWKRSSIGPGAKAGGPNYVSLFMRTDDVRDVPIAAVSTEYKTAWKGYFLEEHDPSGLRCESNVFRYRPCKGVILRLADTDEQIIARARAVAKITGVPLVVSIATEVSDEEFASQLPSLAQRAEFLRTVEAPSDVILRAAIAADLNWIDAPITANGRCELRYWLREQSISETRHRYGQISESAEASVGI